MSVDLCLKFKTVMVINDTSHVFAYPNVNVKGNSL